MILQILRNDLSWSYIEQTIPNAAKHFVGRHLITACIPESPGTGWCIMWVALRFSPPTGWRSLLEEPLSLWDVSNYCFCAAPCFYAVTSSMQWAKFSIVVYFGSPKYGWFRGVNLKEMLLLTIYPGGTSKSLYILLPPNPMSMTVDLVGWILL